MMINASERHSTVSVFNKQNLEAPGLVRPVKAHRRRIILHMHAALSIL